MLEFLATVMVIASDQICKKAANDHIPEGEYISVIKDRLYFANVKNSGAAYGLFSNDRKTLLKASQISMVLIAAMFIGALKNNGSKLEKTSLALLLGGGISNIYDRIVKKNVTDYIFIKGNANKESKSKIFAKIKPPVFNIADLAVLVGAILNFINEFREK